MTNSNSLFGTMSHIVFSTLNVIALFGWIGLGYYIVFLVSSSSSGSSSSSSNMEYYYGRDGIVLKNTMILEMICIIEVIRIALGNLPGNLLLGSLLHMIRIITITEVLPRTTTMMMMTTTTTTTTTTTSSSSSSSSPLIIQFILLSWVATEISRYPMYIWKSNPYARKLRMIAPIVTFPIGCATEAYAAGLLLWKTATITQQQQQQQQEEDSPFPPLPVWLQIALIIMLAINGILGPTMAYPFIIKKARQEIMFGKNNNNKTIQQQQQQQQQNQKKQKNK